MRRSLLVFVLAMTCAGVHAQIPTDDPEREFGGRISYMVQKPVSNGWAVFGEEELRTAGRMLNYMRSDLSGGVSYRLSKYFKTELRYTMLTKVEYRTDISFRHRLDCDFVGSYKTGPWRFSLRERMELTHHPGDANTWERPRNELDAKSRLKVAYKINKRWRPYVGAELKYTLNAPELESLNYSKSMHRYLTPQGDIEGEPGWMIRGYNRQDLIRVRSLAGVEVRKNKKSIMKVYAMLDWDDKLDIDTNHSGTILKSLVYVSGYRLWLGVSVCKM